MGRGTGRVAEEEAGAPGGWDEQFDAGTGGRRAEERGRVGPGAGWGVFGAGSGSGQTGERGVPGQQGHPMTQHGQRVQGRGRAVGVRAVMEEAAAAAAAAATAALGPGPGPRGVLAATGGSAVAAAAGGAGAGRGGTRAGAGRVASDTAAPNSIASPATSLPLKGRRLVVAVGSSSDSAAGRVIATTARALPLQQEQGQQQQLQFQQQQQQQQQIQQQGQVQARAVGQGLVIRARVDGASASSQRMVQAPSLPSSQSHVSRAADIRQSVKATSSLPEFPPGRRDLKRVRSEPEVAPESVVRDLVGTSRGAGVAAREPASATQSRLKPQLIRVAGASAARSAGERAQATATQSPVNGSREAASAPAGKATIATAGKAAPVRAGGAGGLFSGPRPLSELLKRKRASDEGGGGDGGVAGNGAQQEKAAGERQRRVARVDVTGGQGEGNVGKTRRLTRVLSGRGGGEVGTKAARMGEGTGAEVSGTGAEAAGGEATAAGTEAAGSENEDVEKAVGPVAATAPVSAPAAAVVEEEKVGHAPDATLADDADDGIILVRSGSSQSKGERAEGEVDLGDEELVDEEDEDYDLEGKLGDLW
ncbi:unnamed protein product [Closterium sp. Naga37s-1]|nr:unnamed protein product [Closterium sp. Naga37s-1]